jgi:hypothetical protein
MSHIRHRQHECGAVLVSRCIVICAAVTDYDALMEPGRVIASRGRRALLINVSALTDVPFSMSAARQPVTD